jgi:hypothetical protein
MNKISHNLKTPSGCIVFYIQNVIKLCNDIE